MMRIPVPPRQILLPFVAAFGVSLGAGTGVMVMRAPVPAKASAVKHDSTKAAARVKSDTAHRTDSTGASHTPVSVPGDSTHPVAAATSTPIAQTAARGQPSTTTTVAPAPVTAPPPASAATLPAARGNSTTAAGGASPVPPVAVRAPTRPARDTLAGQRLAKVFGSMQARDAARVLEQMDDADVRTILGSLSSKQQAAILGNFPTQRAASLLRATLRTNAGADQ